MSQIIEDLQGVPPGSARVLEVADRRVVVTQVCQVFRSRCVPIKGRGAEGLLTAANGRREIATKLVHEVEGVPGDGLVFAANLAGQLQKLLTSVKSHIEIAQDRMVAADLVKRVCLMVPAA
jgi:hypothetical protein